MPSPELLRQKSSSPIDYDFVRAEIKKEFGFESGSKLLTFEEEQILATVITEARENPDNESLRERAKLAIDCLVLSNLPFARRVAQASMGLPAYRNSKKIFAPRDFRHRNNPLADYDDRFQVAIIGMMDAAKRFRPHEDKGKPARFITYAIWQMQNTIDRESENTEFTGHRLPSNVDTEVYMARAKEYSENGTMAENLYRWHLGKIAISFEYLVETFELDAENAIHQPTEDIINDDDFSYYLEEILPEKESDTEHSALKSISTLHYNKLFDMLGLDDRSRRILELRIGLTEKGPCTLDDIGKEFNITRERVRQITNTIHKKILSLLVMLRRNNPDYMGLNFEGSLKLLLGIKDDEGCLPNLRGDNYITDRVAVAGGRHINYQTIAEENEKI